MADVKLEAKPCGRRQKADKTNRSESKTELGKFLNREKVPLAMGSKPNA